MNRYLFRFVLLGLTAITGGCAMCANPDDEAYPSYGGIVERHDPYHGRVGSAFAPPGAAVQTVSAEEVFEGHRGDISRDEPTPAEEVAPPAAMPEASPGELDAEPPARQPMPPAAPEVFFE